MTYVVLKGYLYDPIDCVRPAVAAESGKVYRKDSSFLLYLVLVSDPGSVSPFFRDELLAPVLHFVSVDRGERGSAGRGLYHERSKEVNCFKYTTWILAMQWSWTLMSIRMNQSFHRGKSLPARQEDSKLQIMSR